MGAQAYNLIDKFELSGSVVEIGTERGEGSTAYLAAASKEAGNKFYTVDFDINAPKFPDVEQYTMTGEEFFDYAFPEDEKICFAYLDGFDWIWEEPNGYVPHWILEQVESYKTYGIEMNNTNSQASHMTITKAVAQRAADKCVILFDDTFGAGQYKFSGKGGTACDWLLEQGWTQFHLKHAAAKAFCNWPEPEVFFPED